MDLSDLPATNEEIIIEIDGIRMNNDEPISAAAVFLSFVDAIDEIDNSASRNEPSGSFPSQRLDDINDEGTDNMACTFHVNEESSASDAEILPEESDLVQQNEEDSSPDNEYIYSSAADSSLENEESEGETAVSSENSVAVGADTMYETEEDTTDEENAHVNPENIREKRTRQVKRLKNRSFGRELSEFNREQGKEYQSIKIIDGVRTIVTRKARSMGPPCNSEACKKRTYCQRFTHSVRREAFKHFWRLSLSQKKIFLRSMVDVVPTKSKRNILAKHMATRRTYHLKINGTRKRVCSKFFMSTLGLKFTQLDNWLNPKKDTARRDKSPPNATRSGDCEAAQKFVRDKLEELPKVPSHFCRAGTDKEFLQSDFKSIRDVHAILSSEARKNGVPTVSWSKFHQIFTSLKLAVHELQKDACDDCTAIKLQLKRKDLTEEQKEDLNQKLLEHRASYLRARQEKNNDKKSSDDVLAFVCDLQKIFCCPLLNNNIQYYLSKLQVRNWTCYKLKKKGSNRKGACHLWDESNGSVDASDFATLWYFYITGQLMLDPEITEVRAWSDGCCAQNRNITLANALLYLAIKTGITIIQKFFPTGHSFNEGDSMHSRIENVLRKELIYSLEQFVASIGNARVLNPSSSTTSDAETSEQYDVKLLSFEDFTNFKNVTYYKSLRPGVGVGSTTVNKIRALQYLPIGTINYKLNFDDDWQELPHKNANPTFTPTPKHTSRLPIKKQKYEHLQRLKPFIPEEYHKFYDELPYNE